MTASFVAATSPRGELRFWKFADELDARILEVNLWCHGWDTRPVLTLRDDPPASRCVVCDDEGCEFCPKAPARQLGGAVTH